jgi:hypothetical protein
MYKNSYTFYISNTVGEFVTKFVEKQYSNQKEIDPLIDQ